MKNSGPYKAHSRAEDLVDLAAKRAAQEAAAYHKQELKRVEGRIGPFAIYAWAFFAFAASGIAGGTAYLNSNLQASNAQVAGIATKISVENQEIASNSLDEPTDPITTAALPPAETKPLDTQKLIQSNDMHDQGSATTNVGVILGGYVGLEYVVGIYEEAQGNSNLVLGEREPLVRFRQDGSQFSAALVLGPFDTSLEAETFCTNANTACEVSSYEGDPLFAD